MKREEAAARIEAAGGKVSGSVSKKCGDWPAGTGFRRDRPDTGPVGGPGKAAVGDQGHAFEPRIHLR